MYLISEVSGIKSLSQTSHKEAWGCVFILILSPSALASSAIQ